MTTTLWYIRLSTGTSQSTRSETNASVVCFLANAIVNFATFPCGCGPQWCNDGACVHDAPMTAAPTGVHMGDPHPLIICTCQVQAQPVGSCALAVVSFLGALLFVPVRFICCSCGSCCGCCCGCLILLLLLLLLLLFFGTGNHYDKRRMTWIKTNFFWMMYRCDYGRKDANQSNILAVTIKRAAFEELLALTWSVVGPAAL
jgi:hypothetical protein